MLTDQERLSLLQKLVQVSLELTSTMSLDELLHQIVDAAAELTCSEAAGILLSRQAMLRFVAATSHRDQLFDILVPIDHSFAGSVFQSGQAAIVLDVRQDARYFSMPEQVTGLVGRSLLAVPLVFKEHKLGVLEVENKIGEQEYDQGDIEILSVLAAQATVAIQNVYLWEELQQSNENMKQSWQKREEWFMSEQNDRKLAQALGKASASLTSTLDLQEVIDRILEQITLVIPNDASNLMLIEEDDQARVFQGRGYERFGTAGTLDSIQLNIMQVSGLHKMLETGQPLLIPDVREDETWVYSREEHTWIRSYIGVPIRAQERVIGFLNVLSASPNAFSQRDAKNLQEFSYHAAIAITNAHLHQQVQQELAERSQIEQELRRHRVHLQELVAERTAALEQTLSESRKLNQQLQLEVQARQLAEENLRLLAITDPLTGVYNRRHLWLLAEQVMKHAQRYQREISAIMLDVDHFKRINDTYGHAIGDEALRLLSSYLRDALRQADVLARYGGEEFVILMPETNLETGCVVAERLLDGIRNLVLNVNAVPVKLTVSIGVAVWHSSDEDIESLINRADQALYMAKQAGRDCIRVIG